MKFFGWGKGKHIQSQTALQPVKSLDARSGLHGLDSGASMGPRLPCKGTSTRARIKQQGLFGEEDDGYHYGACPKHKENSSGKDAPVSEEKLQDTIRFVFSHEHEGLLAVGTFALEQLAAVRDIIDEHQKAVAGGLGQNGDGFASRLGTMQSSNDEHSLSRPSWLAKARMSACEQPVYASDETSGVDPSATREQGPNDEEPRALMMGLNQSKALALYKSSGNRTPNAGLKPIVLLTALSPELRNVLDRANQLYSAPSQLPKFVPHYIDSVPPSALLGGAGSDDESFFTSRFCGLFAAKKKISLNSKRLSKKSDRLYIDNDPEEYSKKLTTTVPHQGAKKSIFDFTSNGAMPSLGKLAKMWKSSCTPQPARIAPERKLSPPKPRQEFMGLPCGDERGEVLTAPAPPVPQPQRPSPLRGLPTGACRPEVAEFRRRVAMHERSNYQANDYPVEVDVGADDHHGFKSNRGSWGQWVKTDSEFVVLEI